MSLVFGVLALIFSVVSFFCKDKVKMLFCQIPANIFYCLSFVFAGTFAPFVGVAIATVRTVVFFVFDIKRIQPKIWVLLLFEVVSIAGVMAVFKATLDFLPLLGVLIFTFGMWQKSEDVLRVCAVLCSVLFMIFNIVFGLFAGVFQEGIIILSGVAAIIKSRRNMKLDVIGFDKQR